MNSMSGDAPVGVMALTVEQACRAAGVSKTCLYREISAGRLRATKIGRRTLITTWSLRAWIEDLEARAVIGAPGTDAAARASVAARFGAQRPQDARAPEVGS